MYFIMINYSEIALITYAVNELYKKSQLSNLVILVKDA